MTAGTDVSEAAPPSPWSTLGQMILSLTLGVGVARLAVALGMISASIRMPLGLAVAFFLLSLGEVRFSRTGPRAPLQRRMIEATITGVIMFAVGYFTG